ncbi:MAG TPA: SRPBCC domain-containing protein [Chitinophagaceae bacterium]
MQNKWSEFRLRVNINAPIGTIYNAWSTGDGLTSWFLRKAAFTATGGNSKRGSEAVEQGDQYEWLWHGYPDSIVEKGKILSANGKDKISFTFSLGCPVTISIYPQSDESIVELVESNLPTDEVNMLKHYVGDSKGWIFYLTNLKSVLEGGLDLRNKKLELTDVITS